MPTYRVWAKRIEYEYLDVEAETAEQAERKADYDDGTGFPRWNPMDDIEWEIMPGKTDLLSPEIAERDAAIKVELDRWYKEQSHETTDPIIVGDN